jgi:AcrR family transcriptional regulator
VREPTAGFEPVRDPLGEAGPRERILEAALRLFAERGYEGVTLRQIGAEVGLHNSSLFHHLRGKGELVTELFHRVLDRVIARLAPLEGDDEPELERLVAVCLDVADHFAEAPEEALFVLRAVVGSPGFEAYLMDIDRGDRTHPVVRLLSILWGWLERARRVIRSVDVGQATRNLFGVLLFDPALSRGFGDPDLPTARRRRKRAIELEAFLRGALEPR